MHPTLFFSTLLAGPSLFSAVAESRPTERSFYQSLSQSLPSAFNSSTDTGNGWPGHHHPSGSSHPPVVSRRDVQLAYEALQQWYNQSAGLWLEGGGWWNSANCLTMLADWATIRGPNAIHERTRESVLDVFRTTHHNAPLWNLAASKTAASDETGWIPRTVYGNSNMSPKLQNRGFLDDYYDDEGWWALAWIRAYDVTRNPAYLSEAKIIFQDMHRVFGKTNCSHNSGGVGGIWWDKKHTYVNAIANELFLAVAARLATRVPNPSRDHYLSIAKQQWSWFKASGMINAENTINDGLDAQTCENNAATVWSYNQGVILGALSALAAGTNDAAYLREAEIIADAAIANLSSNGILHDVCEPDCGPDGDQFKGVFTRNLGYLNAASPRRGFAEFIARNARSIWTRDRNFRNNELSIVWSGPFVKPANASTQSSAMDTLVAALALRETSRP